MGEIKAVIINMNNGKLPTEWYKSITTSIDSGALLLLLYDVYLKKNNYILTSLNTKGWATKTI